MLPTNPPQGTFGALFSKSTDGPDREKKGAKATPPRARRDVALALQMADPDVGLSRMRRDVCSEFADAPDLCMSAGLPAFSKQITFFKKDFTMVVGGVIPVSLGFEVGGEFAVMILLNFCLLTLKVCVCVYVCVSFFFVSHHLLSVTCPFSSARQSTTFSLLMPARQVTVTPVPSAVALFDVYAAIGKCIVVCGGLKISGKAADLKFPLPVTIGCVRWPCALLS
jgi:hypothetical protein